METQDTIQSHEVQSISAQEGSKTLSPQSMEHVLMKTVHGGLLYCKNDAFSTILFSNDYFFEMVGYSREEFEELFENHFLAIVEDDIDEIHAKVEAAVDAGLTLDYEYRIRCKNGQIIWIHDTAVYNSSDDAFSVILMDITAQKQLENDLAEKTLGLYAFAFNAPCAIQSIRCDDLKVVSYFTENISEITGYSITEINRRFGGKLFNLIHKDDMSRVFQELQQTFRQATLNEIRYRLMRKDGSFRQVLEKGQIISNSDGTNLYYNVIVDLSRFDLVESMAKQQSPEKIEIVIDWDCTHNQIFVSDMFEKVFGYSLDVAQMHNLFMRGLGIHPEDAERFKRRFNAALEHHEPLSEECRIERSDGSYLWCQVYAQAICSVDGEMVELLATIVSTEEFRGGAVQIVDQRRRDAVTGLYQRAYLEEYLNRYLLDSFSETNEGEWSALLYLGLFNLGLMKNIQDNAVVDEVMRRTSHIVRREMGNRVLIIKVDSAHFALALMNKSSKNVIIKHAESLLVALQEGLSVFTASGDGIACMGIACIEEKELHADEIIERSRKAYEAARRRNESCYVFYEEL